MAGIVDVRYNYSTKHWEAQPRFTYDAESFQHGAAVGTGRTKEQALFDLCNKVPLRIANNIRMYQDTRMYQAPERDLGDDHECLDMDGHRPTPEEFRKRHDDYLLAKKLGHDYRSINY